MLMVSFENERFIVHVNETFPFARLRETFLDIDDEEDMTLMRTKKKEKKYLLLLDQTWFYVEGKKGVVG